MNYWCDYSSRAALEEPKKEDHFPATFNADGCRVCLFCFVLFCFVLFLSLLTSPFFLFVFVFVFVLVFFLGGS